MRCWVRLSADLSLTSHYAIISATKKRTRGVQEGPKIYFRRSQNLDPPQKNGPITPMRNPLRRRISLTKSLSSKPCSILFQLKSKEHIPKTTMNECAPHVFSPCGFSISGPIFSLLLSCKTRTTMLHTFLEHFTHFLRINECMN